MSASLTIRPREAAALLGISTRFLFALTKNGVLPHLKLGDGKRRAGAVLYIRDDLEAWVRDKAHATQAEAKRQAEIAERVAAGIPIKLIGSAN